jgi:hypothetical protein
MQPSGYGVPEHKSNQPFRGNEAFAVSRPLIELWQRYRLPT